MAGVRPHRGRTKPSPTVEFDLHTLSFELITHFLQLLAETSGNRGGENEELPLFMG